jgi:NAD(P)-dependent dehydrogenase (short-subunit alcohol dehydrogenase family)
MMFDLSGKIAVVTGSSRGIGAGIAKVLAAQGAKVVINHRNSADAAEEVAAAIKEAGGEATLSRQMSAIVTNRGS